IGQVFSTSPQASIYYEGGFVGGIATGQTNTALKVGDTIDWFDFPSISGNKGVTIGGDVIAAFTNKPGVKEFLQYMTTADAGSVWAGTGAVISPVKSVPATAYPNELAKREAAHVVPVGLRPRTTGLRSFSSCPRRSSSSSSCFTHRSTQSSSASIVGATGHSSSGSVLTTTSAFSAIQTSSISRRSRPQELCGTTSSGSSSTQASSSFWG